MCLQVLTLTLSGPAKEAAVLLFGRVCHRVSRVFLLKLSLHSTSLCVTWSVRECPVPGWVAQDGCDLELNGIIKGPELLKLHLPIEVQEHMVNACGGMIGCTLFCVCVETWLPPIHEQAPKCGIL